MFRALIHILRYICNGLAALFWIGTLLQSSESYSLLHLIINYYCMIVMIRVVLRLSAAFTVYCVDVLHTLVQYQVELGTVNLCYYTV